MNRAEMIDVAYAAVRGVILENEGRLVEVVVDAIIAAQGDDKAEFRVRRDAPDTSKAVSDKIRGGSLQAQMFRLFSVEKHPDAFHFRPGFTDDELEIRMSRTHQSVSATRNTLMRKGYIVDSGDRRPTRSGNPAIVYVWTGKEAT